MDGRVYELGVGVGVGVGCTGVGEGVGVGVGVGCTGVGEGVGSEDVPSCTSRQFTNCSPEADFVPAEASHVLIDQLGHPLLSHGKPSDEALASLHA